MTLRYGTESRARTRKKDYQPRKDEHDGGGTAVATSESASFTPHFENIAVMPANTADKIAATIHIKSKGGAQRRPSYLCAIDGAIFLHPFKVFPAGNYPLFDGFDNVLHGDDGIYLYAEFLIG